MNKKITRASTRELKRNKFRKKITKNTKIKSQNSEKIPKSEKSSGNERQWISLNLKLSLNSH